MSGSMLVLLFLIVWAGSCPQFPIDPSSTESSCKGFGKVFDTIQIIYTGKDD